MRINKLIFCLLILGISLFLTSCGEKSVILFNKYPISKDNILNNCRYFEQGENIYYVAMIPRKIRSPYLRIQIIKKETKTEFWGYKIFYSKDVRVMKDQVYYYTDYIVIHTAGYYFMQVFEKDNLDKPIARADFWVR